MLEVLDFYLLSLINDYYDFTSPLFQKFDEWLIVITRYLLRENKWLYWQEPYVKINEDGALNISVKNFRDNFLRAYNRYFREVKNKYSQPDNSDLLFYNIEATNAPIYKNIHENKLYNSGYYLAQQNAHILGLC